MWAVRLFRLFVLSALACGLGWSAAGPAHAAVKAPKLTKLRCVPATAPACKGGVKVSVGDALALSGKRLARGQRVTFRWSKGTTSGKVVRVKGAPFAVKVPKKTPIGTVTVSLKDRHGRRSNRLKLKVVPRVAAPPATTSPPTAPPAGAGAAVGGNAVPAVFQGQSIWIWKLDDTEDGNVDAIIARAKQAGISTVFVKSSDGGDVSEASQFGRDLVHRFHAAQLRICAWAFIYGINPIPEAARAAEAIQAGADCFAINAEDAYNARWAEAQQYLSALRSAPGVGDDYPIGFTSHGLLSSWPAIPVSVFLSPRGGAQVAMPQVYWRPNGPRPPTVTVTALSRQIAEQWRIYGRPIVPLGQIYDGATPGEVGEFRAIWQHYGAAGASYFRWGAEAREVWDAFTAPVPTIDPGLAPGWAFLQGGSRSDGVRWAQQHLAWFDPSIAVDGIFGPATDAVLRRFQVARGLESTGGVGPQTWQALLNEPYTYVDWATGKRAAAD